MKRNRILFSIAWALAYVPVAIYFLAMDVYECRTLTGLRNKMYLTKKAAKDSLKIWP